jgi:hypothetical protein
MPEIPYPANDRFGVHEPPKEATLARPLKWITRLHEIRERVVHSKIETWDRKAIENLFDVRRVTAQSLMRAIGELSNVAGAHLTARTSLLEFLDYLLAANDPELAVRTRIDTAAAPPPQKKGFLLPVPEGYKAVRLADLPRSIVVEPGQLTIRGAHAFEILQDLAVLARALENDVDSFVHAWNPAPENVESVEPSVMAPIWAELEAMERTRAQQRKQQDSVTA